MKLQYAAVLLVLLTLSACGDDGNNEDLAMMPGSEPPAIPAALTSSGLLRLPYTITDSTVRSELSRVGLGFSVKLRNGYGEIDSARSAFRSVRADGSNIVYGDVNHDGVVDAIIPLSISDGGDPILELAAVRASGSGAEHFASFPLGRATLKSLQITSGKLRVNYMHTVHGDPGPRNTELLLELPEKQ